MQRLVLEQKIDPAKCRHKWIFLVNQLNYKKRKCSLCGTVETEITEHDW